MLTFGSLNPITVVSVLLTSNCRHLKPGLSSQKRVSAPQLGAPSHGKVQSVGIAQNIIWNEHPVFCFKNSMWCNVV